MSPLLLIALGAFGGGTLVAVVARYLRNDALRMERERSDGWKLLAHTEQRRAKYWERQATSPHPLRHAMSTMNEADFLAGGPATEDP